MSVSQQPLFESIAGYRPLADRMRPQEFDQCVGQRHLLEPDKPLRRAIESDTLHSMVFWGPPGTGKTTLARLIATYCGAEFIALSAIYSGVKDIRVAIEKAQSNRHVQQKPTVLFVDEVHRFNKAQQDAFLPAIEDGSIYFVGATTENPSFELNNALLSRVRVYVLKAISAEDILLVLQRALANEQYGLAQLSINISDDQLLHIARAADGDVRRALNILEIAADLAAANSNDSALTDEDLQSLLASNPRRFDKGGDVFYEQISALHKSVRGSDPDAALYWYARMIDGGCDPVYIARRVVRMASEDIGNADPRALTLALNAWDVYTRLGSPEGELAIAQAIVYLACAAKSNAVYGAYNNAIDLAKNSGSLEVPLHLRNAPTQFMKALDYGKDYQYSHDDDNAFSADQHYFPEQLGQPELYKPVDRGLEIKIAEKLAELRKLRNNK